MLGGGLFLLLMQFTIYRRELFRKLARLPRGYLLKAGLFLVVYMVCFYVAVGEAASREAVIVVGIINYLWPGLLFLFSVPIMKAKANHGLLLLGVLTAFSGTTTAVLAGHGRLPAEIRSAFYGNVAPYFFAFIAAVAWGIYSNMTKRHQTNEDEVALPVLLIISAGVILIIQLLKGETPRLLLSGSQYWEFSYVVIFPTALAYLFWDKAMKRGNKELVTALSYLIPLASTLISGYYLGVPIGLGFWAAVLLVVAGAVLCKRAVKAGDRR